MAAPAGGATRGRRGDTPRKGVPLSRVFLALSRVFLALSGLTHGRGPVRAALRANGAWAASESRKVTGGTDYSVTGSKKHAVTGGAQSHERRGQRWRGAGPSTASPAPTSPRLSARRPRPRWPCPPAPPPPSTAPTSWSPPPRPRPACPTGPWQRRCLTLESRAAPFTAPARARSALLPGRRRCSAWQAADRPRAPLLLCAATSPGPRGLH